MIFAQPKVIRAAEQAHLWPELVFLYIIYGQLSLVSRSMSADSLQTSRIMRLSP